MRSAIRVVAALAAATTFLVAAGSASARVVQRFGTAGADRLRFPDRIVYGPDGLLHVVDFGDAVRDPTPWARSSATSLPRPAAVPAIATYVDGPDGSVYAIAGHRIQKVGPDGAYRGAVASDRSAVDPRAAVARDGSIYATSWHIVASDGVILKLAPITAIDLIPPTISVRSFSSPPLPRRAPQHARLVLGRMVLSVSEDAAYRVVLRRRATTRNRRHPDFGRYMHIATVDVPHLAAGAHRRVLDARAFSYIGKVPPAGRYRLTFVATDDSGNESRPARITFTVTRSRRG
jgi:hypothetical protein